MVYIPPANLTQASAPYGVLEILGSVTNPDLEAVRVTRPTTRGRSVEVSDPGHLPAILIYEGSTYDDTDPDDAGNVLGIGHPYLELFSPGVGGDVRVSQLVLNDTAGTYPWVIIYARPAPDVTGGLHVAECDNTFTVTGGAGYISYASFVDFDEIRDGWRKAIVELDTPITLDGLGTPVRLLVWSDSDDTRCWEILGASSNPTTYASGTTGAACGYGGDSAYALLGITTPDYTVYTADLMIGLAQAMPDVEDLAVAQETQALSTIDPCGTGQPGIPTGLVYNALSWTEITSAAVSGFGHYQVQRRDTTMDAGVWETIAEITSPYVTELDDYEPRVGVESSYRIRMVHATGVVGDWSDSVESTIVAPGVTGRCVDTGVMVMTTNADPAANAAYVSSGGRGEDFTFVEAGWESLSPLFGRDYQYVVRPAERGGVTFTRPVTVNNVGIPDETLDNGFTSLRDLAWDAVPYVCVRDELGNRWLSSLTVPSGNVRRHDDAGGSHTMVAQVTVTETCAEPSPVDVEAPYLGLQWGANERRYAECPDPSAITSLEDVELQMELIVPEATSYLGWDVAIGHYTEGPPEALWELAVSTALDGAFFQVFNGVDTFPSVVDYETTPFVRNQKFWLRIVYDHDVGAGDATCWYYVSDDDRASWTAIGSQTDTSAALDGDDSGILYVYPLAPGVIVRRALFIDQATSTTFASPDFVAAGEGTTSFTDDQGNTWSVSGWR